MGKFPVWVLGSDHTCADKSIGWHGPLPNLADASVLVVDMTTLTKEVLERMGKPRLDLLQSFIRDKLLNNGIVVVITQPSLFIRHDLPSDSTSSPPGSRTSPPRLSNYHMFPVEIPTEGPLEDVSRGERILVDSSHDFKEYMEHVKSFAFYINKSIEEDRPLWGDENEAVLRIKAGRSAKDGSGHYLGCTLVTVSKHAKNTHVPASIMGRLVLLPPPTEPMESAIARTVSVYKEVPARGEAPPAWASEVHHPGLDRLEAQTGDLEQRWGSISKEIGRLTAKRAKLKDHLRLLYTKGPDLEDAVCRAFQILGFSDIRRGKDLGKEDWTFDASTNGYRRVVVEVKGADARTGRHGLLQCSGWIDEHFDADGDIPKGVFIANQHRMLEYPSSSRKRIHFAKNELDYARIRGICIVPSYALFEAVNKVLGGEAPDRTAIEDRITGTKGILEHDLA